MKSRRLFQGMGLGGLVVGLGLLVAPLSELERAVAARG